MSRPLSRRSFVRAGTATALLTALPRTPLLGQLLSVRDPAHLDDLAVCADSDQMRTLALRAVDAARAAGATYADVRLTRTVTQRVNHAGEGIVRADVSDSEELGFGVRALINGYWGFSASPYWNPGEATRLAQDAVHQASTNALGSPRIVDWTPIPTATGTWVTPGIDPFSIPLEEKIEFVNAWRQTVTEAYDSYYTTRLKPARLEFTRQEWVMASTEGSVIAQTFFNTMGEFKFDVSPRDWQTSQQEAKTEVGAEGLSRQRGGWEILLDARVRDQIPVLIENVARKRGVDVRPVEIGRYDVVFDAKTTGAAIGTTLGIATQLDRALGLEANASGTSYLGPDPMDFLGMVPIGAPILNISANRSMPKGNATVKWDEEGVLPDEFPLITDGHLVDYQTTREQASWIKTWYDKQHRPVQSHGCATAQSALSFPIQQPPNLVLRPGTAAASFETLVGGVKQGYAFMKGSVSTDMQGKQGYGGGEVREIVNGKLGDVIAGAAFLFNSLEFWKNITALGDSTSVEQVSGFSGKGEPGQASYFSVAAVPMTVKGVSIIESKRRA